MNGEGKNANAAWAALPRSPTTLLNPLRQLRRRCSDPVEGWEPPCPGPEQASPTACPSAGWRGFRERLVTRGGEPPGLEERRPEFPRGLDRKVHSMSALLHRHPLPAMVEDESDKFERMEHCMRCMQQAQGGSGSHAIQKMTTTNVVGAMELRSTGRGSRTNPSLIGELIELKLKVANQQTIIDTLAPPATRPFPQKRLELRPPGRRDEDGDVRGRDREVRALQEELQLERERVEALTREKGWSRRVATELEEENEALRRHNRRLAERPPGEAGGGPSDGGTASPEEDATVLQKLAQDLTQNPALKDLAQNLTREIKRLQDANEGLREENLRCRRELELMRNAAARGARPDGLERASSVGAILTSRRLESRSEPGSSVNSQSSEMSTSRTEEFEVGSVPPRVEPSSFGWY